MQVRSMGPISEMDMVKATLDHFNLFNAYYQSYSMDCYFRQSWVDKRLSFSGYKVIPVMVLIMKYLIKGCTRTLHRDAQKDLETGHICLQWKEKLSSHYHYTEPVCQVS